MRWQSTDAGGRAWTIRTRIKLSTNCFISGFLYILCFLSTQCGAQKRTRTSTSKRTLRPERSASTNSAIWARVGSVSYSGGAADTSTRDCRCSKQRKLRRGENAFSKCADFTRRPHDVGRKNRARESQFLAKIVIVHLSQYGTAALSAVHVRASARYGTREKL